MTFYGALLAVTACLLCSNLSLGRLQKQGSLRRRAQDTIGNAEKGNNAEKHTPVIFVPEEETSFFETEQEATDEHLPLPVHDKNFGGQRHQSNPKYYIEYKGDITRREGLGESPGITALEYLGTGYNLIEGNPRGGLSTELDPGFRSSVVLLEQVQTDLTIDQEFTVPIGTQLRYLTSCDFSSTATEVSTTADYTTELSRETMVSGSFGLNIGIGAFSFGGGVAFSESEKYRAFANDRLSAQTTSFESTAFCTEYEGRLNEYHDHKLQAPFMSALFSLPRTFNATEEDISNAFERFITEYGTHYVSRVVLGAKHIFTTEMSTQDVLRLRENEVEVSSTLSAKVMFGYNADDDSSSSNANGNTGDNNLFNFVTNSAIDSSSTGNSGSITGEVSTSTTESVLQRSLEQIRSVATRVTEVNIGGTPPSEAGDWREWAATAKDRPMPIITELRPLFALMEEELIVAYSEALDYIYVQRNATEDEGETVKSALNLGVSQPNGDPISSYTVDPLEDYRTLTILTEPETRLANDTDEVCLEGGENPFFRYELLWENSDNTESAVFANLIRDNIAPNTQEDERELGIFDNRFTDTLALRNSLYTFGLNNGPGRSTIAVFEQTDLGSFNELSGFTYVTADNLPDTEEIVVGVVHPQGFAVNKVFSEELGFEIEMDNDREFIIKFNKNFSSPPTFIVSPMWFPTSDERYPCNVGEIQVGLRNCTATECRIQVGAQQLYGNQTTYNAINTDPTVIDFFADLLGVSPYLPVLPTNTLFGLPQYFSLFNQEFNLTEVEKFNTDQFLGFSFMAIDQDLPSGSLFNSTLGIVHGQVTVTTNRTDANVNTSLSGLDLSYNISQVGQGFTATAKFSQSDPFTLNVGELGSKLTVTDQVVGGVRIDFDSPFIGIPAVFASPITEDFEYGRAEFLDRKITYKRSSLFGLGLFPKTKKSVVERTVEVLQIPSTLVEHVTEKSTFIKAGIVSTTNENIFDETEAEIPAIYTPVSFHFVAIGPIERSTINF